MHVIRIANRIQGLGFVGVPNRSGRPGRSRPSNRQRQSVGNHGPHALRRVPTMDFVQIREGAYTSAMVQKVERSAVTRGVFLGDEALRAVLHVVQLLQIDA